MEKMLWAIAVEHHTLMPNLDFYAAYEDHDPILDFIFSSEKFRVFESYSRLDHGLVEFKSAEHFREHFGSGGPGETTSILLQLFTKAGCGEPLIRRIKLKPGALGNAKFRFTCEGWGLIQLHIETPRQNLLRPSHTNHNSEKRALAWAPTYRDELGEPSEWDWAEIERASRKLDSFIRRLSVEKVGSRPVLPVARKVRDAGVKFIG